MNKYAIFGVMGAGLALLTTTIVSVLPVQLALAVCAGKPFTLEKVACANDPVTGGGAYADAPNQAAAGANSNNKHLFGHTGLACTESFHGGHLLKLCVP